MGKLSSFFTSPPTKYPSGSSRKLPLSTFSLFVIPIVPILLPFLLPAFGSFGTSILFSMNYSEGMSEDFSNVLIELMTPEGEYVPDYSIDEMEEGKWAAFNIEIPDELTDYTIAISVLEEEIGAEIDPFVDETEETEEVPEEIEEEIEEVEEEIEEALEELEEETVNETVEETEEPELFEEDNGMYGEIPDEANESPELFEEDNGIYQEIPEGINETLYKVLNNSFLNETNTTGPTLNLTLELPVPDFQVLSTVGGFVSIAATGQVPIDVSEDVYEQLMSINTVRVQVHIF